MTDSTTLAPCPFCGSSNVSNRYSPPLRWIECAGCGACSIQRSDPELSVAAWNRRAPAPASSDPVALPAGIVPVAHMTRNDDGDPVMLFFDKDEASTYCDDGDDPEDLYTAAQVQAMLAAAPNPAVSDHFRGAAKMMSLSGQGREPLTCAWTHDEDDGSWDSACGEAWQFSDGGPVENNVRFCQGCGKPVGITAALKGGQDAE